MANTDYTWVKIAGEDGKSLYTWVLYADNASGNNHSNVPTSTSTYMGLRHNNESDQANGGTDATDPTKYTWVKIKGDDGVAGLQGPAGADGKDGVAGKDGADGKCVEIKGSVANETDLTNEDKAVTGQGYIVQATGDLWILTGSSYSNKAHWHKVGQIRGDKGEKGDKGDTGAKGDKGEQGIQGPQGNQGVAGPAGPAGASGTNGTNGKDGAAGKDGVSLYTWIAFSANADGSGYSTQPTAKTKYLGIKVNNANATE